MRMTWLFGHGNAPRAPVIVALLVIDGLIDDSPPDWNGVYVAKEK